MANKAVISQKEYRNIDFTTNLLVKGEYDECTFINCTFSNVDMSNIQFIECQFENCDLSGANIVNTGWKEVFFKECKLIGIQFDKSDDFLLSISFIGCKLNFSSFYQLKLKNTRFESCKLEETDFSEANLEGAIFDNCNCSDVIFEKTILNKADFRTSYNYSFDPEKNSIKNAKFSKDNVIGLLNKYDIQIS